MIDVRDKKRFIKFFKKRSIIDSRTGCWLYQLRLQKGYARVNYENQKTLLHRFSLHVFTGFDLNSLLVVCHVRQCINKNCWNPDHLYAGTEGDNVRDSVALGTHHLTAKTHCKYGHPLDSYFNDTSRGRKHRYCRQCREIRVREWRARAKAKTIASAESLHVKSQQLD